jgi:hypothetical protein
MRSHLLFAVLASTSLALLAPGSGDARAGSFFGPCCYGANYTSRYPNRSHNVFGCGPGCPCRAWHPFFRPGLSRRPHGPNDGMPVGAMPVEGMPVNGIPVQNAPPLPSSPSGSEAPPLGSLGN